VQFIMEPINKLIKDIMFNNKEAVFKACAKVGISMSQEDQQLEGKQLHKNVFKKWLNSADVLLEMIVAKLPSPIEAQAYRTKALYDGPLDDPCAVAMQKCDPNGPLMVYISKMVKTLDKGRFYAYGRVFSGTVRTGMKVRIMGPNYTPGMKTDLYVETIQRAGLMM
jgi:elongation factor 2